MQEYPHFVGLHLRFSFISSTDFVKFLDAVAGLSYEEKIDYDRMRGFLQCALRRLGANAKTVKLTFASTQSSNVSSITLDDRTLLLRRQSLRYLQTKQIKYDC